VTDDKHKVSVRIRFVSSSQSSNNNVITSTSCRGSSIVVHLHYGHILPTLYLYHYSKNIFHADGYRISESRRLGHRDLPSSQCRKSRPRQKMPNQYWGLFQKNDNRGLFLVPSTFPVGVVVLVIIDCSSSLLVSWVFDLDSRNTWTLNVH